MTDIHVEAMAWLRFGKRLTIVTSEVGRWNADVLGLNNKFSVEVEVKKSRSDLRAEFKNKRDKHATYASAAQGRSATVPNFLYFMVPEELEQYALEVLAESAPKAGLLVMTEGNRMLGKNTRVSKKAAKLHANPPTQKFMQAALMRMGSELVGVRAINEQLTNTVFHQVRAVSKQAVLSVTQALGVLDVEDPEEDLLGRAQELAYAMNEIDPRDFLLLSNAEQAVWKDRATRLLLVQTKGRIDETPLFQE